MRYSNFKKYFAITLTLIVFILSFVTVSADSPEFTITGESVTAQNGETVSVKFTFTNNPGISIFSLNIDYDTNVLELKEINGNPLMSGTFNENVSENFILWMNYSGDVNFNCVAFTAVFDIKKDANVNETEVTVSLPYESDNILNNQGQDIIPKIVSTKVNLSTEKIIGDVNGDKSIDSIDLVFIKRMILGVDVATNRADVNADGIVNILDLVRLKKYLADKSVPIG